MAIEQRVVALPDLRRWTKEIVALETHASLPARVVLVPSEAHAHALRMELVTSTPRALAGTHFFTAAAAARSVLDAAGVGYSIGEEVRRPLRLRALFRSGLELAVYRAADLTSQGWEEAFASTIDQLEAAALRPESLDTLDDPRAWDLSKIWRALDADAGASWTIPRIMEEASARLRAGGEWPYNAPVLAAVTGSIDTAHARLLRVIPRATLGVVPGRPARRRVIERVRHLLGNGAADLITAVPASDRTDELGLLGEHLFEAPERLATPDRRRSTGPDGTVTLELHAGTDAELDAAARWAAEEVFLHRTRLQDMAILTPNAEPLCALIAARLRALEWPDDAQPVYLACGEAAVSVSAGARLLAVLRAVQRWLPAEALEEILPRLRLDGTEGHLSPAQARAMVDSMGTRGGSPTRPADALHWRDRMDPTDPVARAIGALVTLSEAVLTRAPLRVVWDAFEEFVDTHVIAARDVRDLVAQLRADVRALADDCVTSEIVGIEAVDLIVSRLMAMRLHRGRYGDPSIYVGTIAGAAGLRFTAVRLIGLAEGAFPGTQRKDAIFPAESRRQLPAFALVSDDDYAAARLHAFDQVIRGVAERIVLSAPHTDHDGSEREPAALFVEVGAALARPNGETEARTSVIPTMQELERYAFLVARVAARARRSQHPLSSACWLACAADDPALLPSVWSRAPVTDPREVVARALSMHGILGAEPLTASVPGGAADRPLSASALRSLLMCPQQFLLERVLRFRPRARRAEGHRIDPGTYGLLFHRTLEVFSRAHGVAFGARERTLADWLALADAIAVDALETLLRNYPLEGYGAHANELRRLRRDVATFVADDWCPEQPRTFVGAEREFGGDSGVTIPAGSSAIYVAGRIDRIDVENGVTLVRDFKTGRAPNEEEVEPDISIDLQLAVYATVARELAAQWGVPADVAAAYAYIDRFSVNRERAFRREREALKAAGEQWLSVAGSLLREQTYVKTPDERDCHRCAFSSVCGDETGATVEVLRSRAGAIAAFRELKT